MRPPILYTTNFQDPQQKRISQPWLQWLELLRAEVNTTVSGGVTQHSQLQGVTPDQHHSQQHVHTVGDGSGQISHTNLSGVTADQHHSMSHLHNGIDSSGIIDYFGSVSPSFEYNLPQVSGVLDTLSRSDHNHGTVYPLIPWWAGKTLYAAAPTMAAAIILNLYTVDGITLTRTSPSAPTDLTTATELVAAVSSSTSGTRAGWLFNASHPLFFAQDLGAHNQFNYQQYFGIRLKLSSITDVILHVVVGNTSVNNNASPWGAAASQNGGLAFRFVSTGSANWELVGKNTTNSAALGFTQDLGIPVVADQLYTLELAVVGQGTTRQVFCYIDGILKHIVTDTTTYDVFENAGNVAPGWVTSLFPQAAAQKQLGVAWQVWGTNSMSLGQPRPNGFLEWGSLDTYHG